MNNQLSRVFSGIQPTGIPHLGNYFGALVKWQQLAKSRECTVETPNVHPRKPCSQINTNIQEGGKTIHSIRCDIPIYSIVDVHAYSSARVIYGHEFYQQILSTTASLLAIGLNTENCVLFRQSDIFEHNYLSDVLDNFVSTQRLTRMTQFKEKLTSISANFSLPDFQSDSVDFAKSLGKSSKSFPNGLLNYPVLQTADILLYRSHLVPVGEDQIQHIELARDIANKFNITTNSLLFPEPRSLLNPSKHARRIKSLRNPTKKMSKSDADKKSFIEIVDEPEIILEKVKKAVTDNIGEIYYEPDQRPGISNLMRIHYLVTGETFDQIRNSCSGIESGRYKLMLAEILISYFKPIRLEYNRIRKDRQYLEQVLSEGREKAQRIASETIKQVRHLLGSFRLD